MRYNMAVFVLLFTGVAQADDWPQWMGPKRDDIWRETGILEKFPGDGPKVLWRVPIHGGYAGPAVANGRVFVTDYEMKTGKAEGSPMGRQSADGSERVLCLDAKTGTEIWKHQYPCT